MGEKQKRAKTVNKVMASQLSSVDRRCGPHDRWKPRGCINFFWQCHGSRNQYYFTPIFHDGKEN